MVKASNGLYFSYIFPEYYYPEFCYTERGYISYRDGNTGSYTDQTISFTNQCTAYNVEVTRPADIHGIDLLSNTAVIVAGYKKYVQSVNSMNAYLFTSLEAIKTFGGTNDDAFNSVKVSSNGDEYLCVGYTNSNDGDVSGLHSPLSGTSDYWVIKFSAANRIMDNVFPDLNNNNIKDAGESNFNKATIKPVRPGLEVNTISEGYNLLLRGG
jgi:hypothetical protein